MAYNVGRAYIMRFELYSLFGPLPASPCNCLHCHRLASRSGETSCRLPQEFVTYSHSRRRHTVLRLACAVDRGNLWKQNRSCAQIRAVTTKVGVVGQRCKGEALPAKIASFAMVENWLFLMHANGRLFELNRPARNYLGTSYKQLCFSA